MRRRGVGGPGRRGPARPPARMAARMAARRTTRMTVRRTSRMRRRRRRRRVILVGGMVALGAAAVHKYSKRDVERIEQHTGKSAEELTDEELAQASQDLGIQQQEMTEDEWNEVESADGGFDEEYEDESDYIEELERLASLRDKGIITDDEFEAKKKELLGL